MQVTNEAKKPDPIPSWMQIDAEGVTVQLTAPSTINGVQVDSIRLRSPTLREVRTAQKVHSGDEEKVELMLFSSLADTAAADLEGLKLKDYVRVQTAYFRMDEDDEL